MVDGLGEPDRKAATQGHSNGFRAGIPIYHEPFQAS